MINVRHFENAMGHAELEAKMATCGKLQVGVAIYSLDWQLLSTGRNGNPRGELHCLDDDCYQIGGHCQAIHAEENSLLQGARTGVRLQGGRMFTTHVPCYRCAGLIINVGLHSVIYRDVYPDERTETQTVDRLAAAGIWVARLELPCQGSATPSQTSSSRISSRSHSDLR